MKDILNTIMPDLEENHPMRQKAALAWALVARFHGYEKADDALIDWCALRRPEQTKLAQNCLLKRKEKK